MKENLGDLCGLDYDTAYFLKYGEKAPYREERCTRKEAAFDWEQVNESAPYYCWQGTRLPQWFE